MRMEQLHTRRVRIENDMGPDPIKAKIAEAEKAKVHTMLVIGGRDMGCRHRECSPAQQRPARREAEGGSGGGDFGENSRAQGVRLNRFLAFNYGVSGRYARTR